MSRARDNKPEPGQTDVSATVDQPAGIDPGLPSVPRKAGEDPNPAVEPSKDASAKTPDATATPPQRVQHERSQAFKAEGEDTGADDPNDTGERWRVKVLRGIHMEGGRTYKTGEIVNSRTDLVGRFGTEKFESVD